MQRFPCYARAALIGAALATTLSAQTIWVSPTGSDAGPGTASRPLRTISRAVAVVPVDGTILVSPGAYSIGETFPIVINKAGVSVQGRGDPRDVRLVVANRVPTVVSLEADRSRWSGVSIEAAFGGTHVNGIAIGHPQRTLRDARVDRCFITGRIDLAVVRPCDGVRIDSNQLLTASIRDPQSSSRVFIEHNTLVSVGAASSTAVGIESNGARSRVTNNIVVGRSVGVATTTTTTPALRFVRNNVFACTLPWRGIAAPAGNLSSDPLFVDAANGDYRLLAFSPMVDAGSSRARVEADLLAFPRELDGVRNGALAPDLGCHEFSRELLRTARVGRDLVIRVESPVDAAAAVLFGDSVGLTRVSPFPALLLGLTGGIPISQPVLAPSAMRLPLPPLPADLRIFAQAYVARFPVATSTNRSEALLRGLTAITEQFQSAAQLDAEASSGRWGGGKAVFGQVGGDSLHGEFDYRLGTRRSPTLYQFSTDSTTIPRDRTRSGRDEVVTDGQFRFSTFHVPAGITVSFVGSRPPVIRVSGLVDIQGRIEVSAQPTLLHNGVLASGQQPSGAGPGGGLGGRGADRSTGTGQRPNNFGSNGSDVQLVAGHAYAARARGTGGRGASPYPLDCLNSSVAFLGSFNIFSDDVSAGGSGGGFLIPGSPGRVIQVISNRGGPPTAGGMAFDPLPVPGNVSHLEHFLIGGSGGGGGSTHPFASAVSAVRWRSGAAGGGGSGPVALRCGGGIRIGSAGEILARGAGTNGSYNNQASLPGVGGAGSGGGVVLQTDGQVMQQGLIDLRGGTGGRARIAGAFLAEVDGGDGGAGFLRIETPQPSTVSAGTVQPPASANNIGALTDTDSRVSQRSKFYDSQSATPVYVRYQISALVNGRLVVYSDDPAVGVLAGPGQALEFSVQGVELDASGRVLSSTPWLRRVRPTSGQLSLADFGERWFRFALVANRQGRTVEVTRVSIERAEF